MSDWQPIDFFRPVLTHPVGGDLPQIVVPLLTLQLPEVALAAVLLPVSRGFRRLGLQRYSGTSACRKGSPLGLATVVTDFGCFPAITTIIGSDLVGKVGLPPLYPD
jgi:hypothetical protein